MNMVRALIATIMFAVASVGADSAYALTRRALLIGISDYGNPHLDAGRWRDIHGANDVRLLYPILKKQGFKIDTLTDKAANYKAIVLALTKLLQQCRKGDIVYIHFSMHGQPYEDIDGDEDDGWDEALIPYDAKMRYVSEQYTGQCHLLDDQLGALVSEIRKAVGPSGHVYVAIDACHAGSSSRGEDDVRGTFLGFSPNQKIYKTKKDEPKKYFKVATVDGQSPVTFLEACQSDEVNKEIRDPITKLKHGPLSLHIYGVIKGIAIGTDPNWVLDVDAAMGKDSKISEQHMVIEKSW